MEILRQRVTRQDLAEHYTTSYPTVVKAVVDLGRGVMAVDAEWHADLEALLLEDGARQEDLWGVNLRIHMAADDFLRYESLINMRPSQRNFSMEVSDPALRARIKHVVDSLVDYGQAMGVAEPTAAWEAHAAAPAGLARDASLTPFGFKHHRLLTPAKWQSFARYKRVLMVVNELNRAASDAVRGYAEEVKDCYERALELLHATGVVARLEADPPEFTAGLLRLSERVAHLYTSPAHDEQEHRQVTEDLIALDPEAYRLLHQAPSEQTRQPAR